ncbi:MULTISPECIES: endonuclease domain-containing protein [unclassified Brenneria]|uniref:endonuclease domain-containing protein n=1 Tax=unclassified Brenneria TaxID=2634434 RepID=UPI0029C50FC7|nr:MULTISPECIES: endonuclease domain-containing protein [unclassified Brenneria]MDX5630092.1 endonuclease domain-containing protein [Brenneria sp. L3-3Z]MDX5697299.1 endonuclease domain-containing protein [Brenneria sp. L4-2C]
MVAIAPPSLLWGQVNIFNRRERTGLRRELRQNPTEPERRLWRTIRQRQLGVKFRRQHGIGIYIVDFYCAERYLVIEVDGDSHFSAQGGAYDGLRDAYIRSLGLRVLRISNTDIMQNIDGVLMLISDMLASSTRK